MKKLYARYDDKTQTISSVDENYNFMVGDYTYPTPGVGLRRVHYVMPRTGTSNNDIAFLRPPTLGQWVYYVWHRYFFREGT